MSSIIFFLLFLLQFIVLPFGISPFETPKVYIAEILISGIVLWYVSSFSLKPFLHRRFIPLLLLAILGGLQLVFFQSADLLFGNVFRMQGIFLFWLLLAFTVISTHISIKSPSHRLITIILLLQLLAVIFIEGTAAGRGVGTLGEPNALASTILFMWPWLFFAEKKQKNNVLFNALGVGIAVIIILFSGSRSGFIALGLQGLFLLLLHFKFSFIKAVFICLVLFVFSLVLPFVQQQTLFENRADVWKVAFAAGLERPIVGWGIGNTEVALHNTAEKINNVVQYQKVDSSHNVFLDWWVQGGIFGLGLVLYIVTNAARIFVRKKEILHLLLLIGLVGVMSFNPVSVVTLIQFWWVIGQSFKQ